MSAPPYICASCGQPFAAHGPSHPWDFKGLPSCPPPSLTGTYRAKPLRAPTTTPETNE